MPQGLQCFDGTGRMIFDYTSVTGKIAGVFDVSSDTVFSAIPPADCRVFCTFMPYGDLDWSYAYPKITVSGSTISCIYKAGATSRVSGRLLYGYV